MCGTWMQTVAISWLVLQLSHSGTILGLAIAAQFLPILIFGVFGGVVADEFNKRRVLLVTQSLFAILALILGISVLSHHDPLWLIFVIAALFGLVQVIDMPTRQSFVSEMVGASNVKNAITLNSTMVNAARIIGPSIGGVLIASFGVGFCFMFNAFSFIAVITALLLMRISELHLTIRSKRQPGQLKAGLKYVNSQPILKITLIMMFIVGTFAYEFPVVFPLFATKVLHGTVSTYSFMMVATGFGAVFGGLYTASHSASRDTQIIWTALIFGLTILLTSIMPSYALVLACLVFVGALSVLFIALGNSTLQLNSDPSMRGRVMSLWAVAFAGTTPIGGPIIGYISDHTSPRLGLATGGLSSIIAAGIAYYIYRRSKTKIIEPFN
jgi:MFS family permease